MRHQGLKLYEHFKRMESTDITDTKTTEHKGVDWKVG